MSDRKMEQIEKRKRQRNGRYTQRKSIGRVICKEKGEIEKKYRSRDRQQKGRDREKVYIKGQIAKRER